MNNEEKILALLEQMNSRQDKTESLLTAMQAQMDGGFTEVRADIKRLDENVAKIEVNHGKKLDALLDSQKSTNERLDNVQAQMNSVEKKLENSMIIKAVTPH